MVARRRRDVRPGGTRVIQNDAGTSRRMSDLSTEKSWGSSIARISGKAHEPHHIKTWFLRSLSLSYQKKRYRCHTKRRLGTSTSKPSFGMTLNMMFSQIIIQNEGLAGMPMTKVLRPGLVWHGSHTNIRCKCYCDVTDYSFSWTWPIPYITVVLQLVQNNRNWRSRRLNWYISICVIA